jgi:2-(1,2-epoxy-1,2-dihydrophenyl)acetyl-CoA isomerase
MTNIRYGVADSVARITLCRPSVSNAIDLPTAVEFAASVRRAAAAGVRALVIEAEGLRFCAGGDVSAMVAAVDRAAYVFELATVFGEALEELAELPIPVVAAVQGAVAGAGLALVLSCDLAVAATSATFVMAYAGIGLTPDCGVSFLLPRVIGQQRALQLALTGRRLDADTAMAWGLVSDVVAAADLDGSVRELVARLAAGPTAALGQAKRLIRQSWETTSRESNQDEARTIAEAARSDLATELLTSFRAAR